GAYGCILATLFRSVQDVTTVASEPGTVLGTFSMNGHAIFVLFDTDAIHSVNCPLRFDDKIRFANLLPLEMSDFDIIIGSVWMHPSGKLTNVKRQVTALKSKVEGLEQKIDTLKNDLNDTKSQRDADLENLSSCPLSPPVYKRMVSCHLEISVLQRTTLEVVY
nr:reverse transcriptase domain-containing protein [Tanacetum cinerariifolium]